MSEYELPQDAQQQAEEDAHLQSLETRDHEEWEYESDEQLAGRLRQNEIEWDRMNGQNPFRPAMTMGDLLKRPAPPMRAYCEKLVYAGALTLLGGDPKAGKSTLLFHLTNAISRGETFLGLRCHKSKVLYISEQNENSIKEQLRKIPKLTNNDELFMLLVEHNHGFEPCNVMVNGSFQTLTDKDGKPKLKPRPFINWAEQIGFWREMLEKTQASVLIIDTLVGFANLRSGESFDPGVMTKYFMDLKSLYSINRQLSIVVLHHLRKENQSHGGDHNIRSFSDIAGSYALRAATDQNIILFKPDEVQPNVRCLKIEGRFGTFDDIAIRLSQDESNYEIIYEPTFTGDRRTMTPEKELLDAAFKAHPEYFDMPQSAVAEILNVSQSTVARFKQRRKEIETAVGIAYDKTTNNKRRK